MKGYIEERAIKMAQYIVETKSTVRQTAKEFGISKSTVHMVVTIKNDGMVRLFGWLNSFRGRFCLVLGSVLVKSIAKSKFMCYIPNYQIEEDKKYEHILY